MKKYFISSVVILVGLTLLFCFTDTFKTKHKSEAVFMYYEWSMRNKGVSYGCLDPPAVLMFSERNLDRAIESYHLTDLFQTNEADLKILIRNQCSILFIPKQGNFCLKVATKDKKQAHQLSYALYMSLSDQYREEKENLRQNAVSLLSKKIKATRIQIRKVEEKLQAIGHRVHSSNTYLPKIKYYSGSEEFNLLRLKRRELLKELNELQDLEFALAISSDLAIDPLRLIRWDVPESVADFMQQRKRVEQSDN